MRDLFVVISGAPGSGKSTLARPLADALGLPLFAKDTMKESLAESLGADDLAESRRLGKAAIEVLFALAATNRSGVFESAWAPKFSRRRLQDLGYRVVEVFCAVPVEVAMKRYADRGPSRHWSHFDAEHVHDQAAWEEYPVPIGGDWPLFCVDTSATVDVAALVAKIDAL